MGRGTGRSAGQALSICSLETAAAMYSAVSKHTSVYTDIQVSLARRFYEDPWPSKLQAHEDI